MVFSRWHIPVTRSQPATNTIQRGRFPVSGGTYSWNPVAARDHRPAERRSLTYTTPPLEKDLEVTGFPVIEFYASSSAVDTDWVVAITDVYPDGYSQILRQNILRARYRGGDEQTNPNEAGGDLQV